MTANLGPTRPSFASMSKERLLSGRYYSNVGFGQDDSFILHEGCLHWFFRVMRERICRWWSDAKEIAFSAYEMGRSDPRKVIFAAKMGTALSLVSVLIFFKEPLSYIGDYAIWAILTVVLVFEFSVGELQFSTRYNLIRHP